LSYCTLRFNDPDKNQKYFKRQRKQASNNAKYLLIVQTILSVFIWLMAFLLDEEIRPGLRILGVVFSIPTIFLGLTKILAHYKAIFVDLFGLAYFVGYVSAAVTLSMTV